MLKHATIVYRELSADEHTANRDLLELLYARSLVRLSTSSPSDDLPSISRRTTPDRGQSAAADVRGGRLGNAARRLRG